MAGELVGKARIPYRVSNLCFGGSHTLYAIYLNTRGAA